MRQTDLGSIVSSGSLIDAQPPCPEIGGRKVRDLLKTGNDNFAPPSWRLARPL